jgi:subtilisin family serine protease
VAAAVGLALSATVLTTVAAHQFSGLTSTAGGYSTYDADQVNAEDVAQTGHGVYVAVLDTGLVPNYADYFPTARVDTSLGTGFNQALHISGAENPCDLSVAVGPLTQSTWVGSTGSSHGTHVASTILGYFYDAPADAAVADLPPIVVRGLAPDVTIIPVRVLADYTIPARPNCPTGALPSERVVFGTSEMVAAGIDYVTGLAESGYRPMVINMSLGGPALEAVEKAAIDRAIAAGVVIVASAGNAGELGMGYPGAYAPVISAGATGWTGEWDNPAVAGADFYRLWWLKNTRGDLPLASGSGEIAEPTSADSVYVADFSSRELAGQELDVLAPGAWIRGPFPGTPGFRRQPWWSKGLSGLGNFFFVGGTSMAAPHVTSAAALLLEKQGSLRQAQVHSILTSTALAIPSRGSVNVIDISPSLGVYTKSWDTGCGDLGRCDPVGAGLIQVDKALAAVATVGGSKRK